MAKVKGQCVKAGFFILNDQSLVKNLSNLGNQYSKLGKHEKRGFAADIAQQQDFKVYLTNNSKCSSFSESNLFFVILNYILKIRNASPEYRAGIPNLKNII